MIIKYLNLFNNKTIDSVHVVSFSYTIFLHICMRPLALLLIILQTNIHRATSTLFLNYLTIMSILLCIFDFFFPYLNVHTKIHESNIVAT